MSLGAPLVVLLYLLESLEEILEEFLKIGEAAAATHYL